MSFKQFLLDSRLEAGIDAMGYVEPTPIQTQAIPEALQGRDVMGLAQTGTGKTAAFLLPILQRLTKGPLRQLRALIVAPTRELAEQIHQNAVQLGSKTKIRSATVYGGVGKQPQIKALRQGTEIIVACPGRLLDLHAEGAVDLTKVEVLVLDEADRMCDMGFLPDIRRILKLLPARRQNLFFSATMPTDIRELADQFLREPVTVQIGQIAPARTVDHFLYPVEQKEKKSLLLALLPTLKSGQILVFTRTKYRARNLARDLSRSGYRAAALQGNMSQNQRTKAMDGFRDGRHEILIATDIAARGLDVAEITHVINFDMPATVDDYTHRIGRTGRASQDGEALTFVVADDEPMIKKIERLLKKSIPRRHLPDFTSDEKPAKAKPAAPPPTSTTEEPAKPPRRRRRRSNGRRPAEASSDASRPRRRRRPRNDERRPARS
ncbi:MAG: DEAD/DEAH box helicase [Anaerolineales bacterium]|nr:DEAD/DEAH box helicase [Anaerolineales bacterium]